MSGALTSKIARDNLVCLSRGIRACGQEASSGIHSSHSLSKTMPSTDCEHRR